MTDKEVEIIVTANVEKACKQFEKMIPSVKKVIGQMQESFNKIDVKTMQSVFNQGMQSIDVKAGELKSNIENKMASVNWQPFVDSLGIVTQGIGAVDVGPMGALADIFKIISENGDVIGMLEALATTILIVSTSLEILSAAMTVAQGVAAILDAQMTAVGLPILAIIAAIVAVIAIVVLVVQNWEWLSQKAGEIFTAIGEFFKNIWNGICEFFTGIWNAIVNFVLERITKVQVIISTAINFIKGIWEAVWTGICDFFRGLWEAIVLIVMIRIQAMKNFISDVVNGIKWLWETVWNGISTFFGNLWNGIVTIVSNCINGIKNTISNILNTIKSIWNSIWGGLRDTVTNIFNGIWNAIRGVINSILGGIEGMANGVIRGVNWIIGALNNLKFSIPDWVPLLGGKTFGFNIRTLNEIALPRLAKGNVAYSPLVALFGEYTGASYNPEITAPQSILKETFDEVLSNHEWSNNTASGELKQLVIKFGSTNVALEIERLLKEARRQSGVATAII